MFGCMVEILKIDFAFVKGNSSKNSGIWVFEEKAILLPKMILLEIKICNFCVTLKILH